MMGLRTFAILGFAAATALAGAWNATGHMVIAAIAQANLSPVARAETERLLKIDATRPGSDDFVTVASWADEIRNDRKETGPWHYKDFFFRSDGKPAVNKPEPINAVSKIEEFTKVLADRSRPDAERAEALRFLIHLVGDVHQPLHATARETDALPKGDRGGNSFLILPPDGAERGPKNLHSLWDGGAGLLQSYPRETGRAVAVAQGRALMAALPKSSFPDESQMNPDKWAEESFAEAKAQVYSTEEGAMPSAEYLERSRALVARKLALAGYRLADLLNRSLT